MNGIVFKPIGVIHTPYDNTGDMPIQPPAGKGIKGMVEVYPEYADGLKDLDGFSHIILLYQFHLSKGFQLEVRPFLDDKKRGLFSTRAPRRPNSIGLSVVRLCSVEKNILYIENVDMVNNTPLLDIKPYVPDFEKIEDIKTGWLSAVKHKLLKMKSDDRFDADF
ncbi:MAG: tRNA (N6-threonylcarbamoyladenosine(37)-N6)-methyltransferase TrmO [Bacteroidales bacterium]|nr:tRNA (N6-threonylcarbamoyladenosine(37)-N6)-methyltransferase TrmO [Bacteroidales bacterium]MBN2763802.1 tRNA (N6-threonylcarbamoyladenosine(37)-N6)-methyltransferase TrmO [Bacteroidales bacterium]